MLTQFRTYHLAVQFHHSCRLAKMPGYLKTQLLRASSSVALNLAEGSGRPTARDQQRFYSIAMGSLRECQAALDPSPTRYPQLVATADHLGASLHKLCRARLGIAD
ncbi:MAG: four helix bundle protein [Oligoflexia bacterium]|nr:four helix bundle protein [Oligoflexia bacterium]